MLQKHLNSVRFGQLDKHFDCDSKESTGRAVSGRSPMMLIGLLGSKEHLNQPH